MPPPFISQQSSLRAGRGAEVLRTPVGFCVALDRPGRWEHPWQTRLHWLGGSGQWVATVRPGFVNGRAPKVRTTVGEALEMARHGSFYQGLINARSGAADIRRAAELAGEQEKELRNFSATTQIDVPLYNNPPLPLRWRAVGWDGEGGVPSFFRTRGAAAAPPSVNPLEVDNRPPETAPPDNLRLLRACDVWLHMPRLALTSTVSIEPGLVTGVSLVTQRLSTRASAPTDALRVLAGTFPATLVNIDPLANDFEEQTWDDLRIGTVWLLSPPGTALGSAPDGRWQAFVQHQLFWNLTYEPGELARQPAEDGFPFIPPLAGGAAQLIINFLTASLNDLTAQALRNVTAHSLAGTFYTATGGGHTSAFPEEPAPAPAGGTGLDKAGRLQAARIARSRAQRAAALDPEFPYRAEPFDLSLLS